MRASPGIGCTRMVLRYFESLYHALDGLWHAVATERNLKLFVAGYILTILGAAYFQFALWEWLTVLLAGGAFLAIELINTSLERFVDAFDEHVTHQHDTAHLIAMKNTKDIAAAAALVIGLTSVIIEVLLFYPYVRALITPQL